MRFQVKPTRMSRSLTVDFPIHRPDEEFVGLIDVANSPVKLKPIIETAWKGFKSGVSPELCELGVGGTYFMHDELRKPIGVFKPHDEEPFHLNNPKGYNYRRNSIVGLKEGIQIGEAAIRECVAYMLDHGNFAGVPATDLVLCHHPSFHYSNNNSMEDIFEMDDVDISEPSSSVALVAPSSPPPHRAKLGSFQEFVKHDGDCEDISRRFIEKFPVHEVHKICQLDIRIFNADRHGGNILYRKYVNELQVETYELIPIDHGYALPSTLDEAYFVWLTWPQAKVPMNQIMLDYIEHIDVEQEVQHLKEKFQGSLREEHVRVLRITTMLLKKSAAVGLTFYDIATISCRHNLKEKCKLEIMCDEAKTSNLSNNFYQSLSTIMDRELQSYKSTGDKF